MSYRSIPNLYRLEASSAVLLLDNVYVTEKIHGTSAHIKFTKREKFNVISQPPWEMTLFSGGVKYGPFEEMLDERFDLEQLYELFSKAASGLPLTEVIFYGEAYGGNCQKMSHIYGPLNFIIFEVKMSNDVGEIWLPVPEAHQWAIDIGLPFVWWAKGAPTIEWLNEMRDRPSEQAKRNLGITDAIGEGIVIRSTVESDTCRFGNRIIAKHKTDKFCETKTPRKIDPAQQKILLEAREIAEEWATENRLEHVLDHLKAATPSWVAKLQNMRGIIGAMTGDIRKESGADGPDPEIKWSKAVQRAIGTKTALVFKKWLSGQIKEV